MSGRPYCYACMKPAVTCVCARVPRIDNATMVWLIQHPRERRHAIGTARLLALALARARLDVTSSRGRQPEPVGVTSTTALLYPGSGARPLEALAPNERPEQLVVLDGTWHHAHTLWRHLGWLRDLPRVTLGCIEPSRYRIRREPRIECVSTVEAVVAALRVLEPATRGLDELLAAFDSMIDDQVRFVRERPGPRRATRKLNGSARGVARAIAERWSDLVIVYAESAADPPGRALVQLTAARVAGGETFDRIVTGPIPAGQRYMRLADSDWSAATPLPQICRDFGQYRRPGDLILAWNQSTLDLMAAAGLEARGLSLKSLWANAFDRAPGTLESVVERAGLVPSPVAVRGRAADRLGNALAVARALRERAGLEP